MTLIKKEKVSPENINIMSQYNAQCSKIKDRLKKHVQNVNTVVASQGNILFFYIVLYTSQTLLSGDNCVCVHHNFHDTTFIIGRFLPFPFSHPPKN